MKYRIELVWNREFHWCSYSQEEYDSLDKARAKAETLLNVGDGAYVKKVRIVDLDGNVLWTWM